MKLNNNHSMKQLKFIPLKINQENHITYKPYTHILSPNNNITIDHISSLLNNSQLNKTPTNQTLNDFKSHKFTQSYKKLDIPVLRIPITSPKPLQKQHYTDRHEKSKKQVQVTPFQIGKYIRQHQYHNVLTPANRTFKIQQPKRPRILSKPRALSFFQEFKLGKILGNGRFGNVYRAQHIQTKMLFAVKQISLQKSSKKLIQRLVYQIKIQSFLKHENCLQLYKYCRQGNNLYLVLQLGEFSLFDKLRQKKYFTQIETAYYLQQTIKALIYLHQNNIIHRDIKPENIVLINNVVKLADFGWSAIVDPNGKRNTFCGTLDYVSPQIVQGAQYDKMVDVWSVGVLCYQLSTGNAPFQPISKSKYQVSAQNSRKQTYQKIINVDLKYPRYLSSEIKDFISKLLAKEPHMRMSLENALHHPFITKLNHK